MSRSDHNRKALKAIRRDLRSHATPAERALWRMLRGRQLGGWKFRRQYSVGPYVLDFFCPKARLAVELDGAIHDDPARADYDAGREVYLRSRGCRVVRFQNRAVRDQPDLVVTALLALLDEGGHEGVS